MFGVGARDVGVCGQERRMRESASVPLSMWFKLEIVYFPSPALDPPPQNSRLATLPTGLPIRIIIIANNLENNHHFLDLSSGPAVPKRLFAVARMSVVLKTPTSSLTGTSACPLSPFHLIIVHCDSNRTAR